MPSEPTETTTDETGDRREERRERRRQNRLKRLNRRLDIAVSAGAMDEEEAEVYRERAKGFDLMAIIELIMMILEIFSQFRRDER